MQKCHVQAAEYALEATAMKQKQKQKQEESSKLYREKLALGLCYPAIVCQIGDQKTPVNREPLIKSKSPYCGLFDVLDFWRSPRKLKELLY